MSDHPEVPRVEFYGDGHSMNMRSAVSRFDSILKIQALDMAEAGLDSVEFTVSVTIRACDCDSTLEGRDSYCPLHGDKS